MSALNTACVLLFTLFLLSAAIRPASAQPNINTCPDYQSATVNSVVKVDFPGSSGEIQDIPATFTYWPSVMLRNDALPVSRNVVLSKTSNTYAIQIQNMPVGTFDIVIQPAGYLPRMFTQVSISSNQPTLDLSATKFIVGDLDDNRRIDIFDYNLLVGNFGKVNSTVGDLNRDSKVDIFDYNLLVTNFSQFYSDVYITTPVNGDVLSNSSVAIDGFTKPFTAIVVFADNRAVWEGQSSSDGSFRLSLPLTDGLHTISAAESIEQKYSLSTHPVTFTVAPKPARTKSVFGVNLILRGECPLYVPKSAQIMESVGIDRARTSLAWTEIENVQGKFVWGFYDKLVDTLTNHNVSVTAILQYSTDWATTAPPGVNGVLYPPKSADFANFAKQVVNRYKDRVKNWEIWNEENAAGNWGPEPNAVTFGELLKAVYPAIKQTDSTAKVILGGMIGGDRGDGLSKPDYNYLQKLYNAGAWPYFDSIGIHPYCIKGPVECDFQKNIDELNGFINSLGGNKTISITEMGWALIYIPGINEQDRTDFMTQLYLLTLANPIVLGTDFFDLADVPGFDQAVATNGLFSADFTPKPISNSYKTIASLLRNFSFQTQQFLPQPNGAVIYWQTYRGNGKIIHALFGKGSAIARIPVPVSQVTLISNMGEITPLHSTDGVVTITVSQSPQFIVY